MNRRMEKNIRIDIDAVVCGKTVIFDDRLQNTSIVQYEPRRNAFEQYMEHMDKWLIC